LTGKKYRFISANKNLYEGIKTIIQEMWDDCGVEEIFEMIEKSERSKDEKLYLCLYGDEIVAFGEFSIRHDYVEGTEKSPVGYVEGIYVKPEHRKNNIARKLIIKGEKWCAKQGCTEMASDTSVYNKASIKFHNNIGFTEANKIVCFVKKVKQD